jgi:ABC-type phosphate transport system permease subunit
MAPLFHDALRNVPRDLKEASYGLGAGRWHTATRVVIPFSMPGLITATALGSLLTMGEVLIPSMLGTFESGMPQPFYDIFDRCPTLTSVGTGLIGGGFSGAETSITAAQRAAGMFAAALLIILAFLVLITAAILQKKFRKRFAK